MTVASLTLNSGTLSGTDAVTVTGKSTWGGGSISCPFVITKSATLTVAGANAKHGLDGAGSITNEGHFILNGPVQVLATTTAPVGLANSGVLDLVYGAGIYCTTLAAFNNTGTINSVSHTVDSDAGWNSLVTHLVNLGKINSLSGELDLNGGSLAGTMNTALGALTVFNGGFESGYLGGSLTITGPVQTPELEGAQELTPVYGNISVALTVRQIGVSVAPIAVTEGNSGRVNAVFKVSLSQVAARTVTVNYTTVDGTAKAASDYLAASGTLTFEPGTLVKTVTIAVNGDSQVEPDEIFSLILGNAVNALISTAKASCTIVNGDSDVTAPSVSVTSPINGAIVTRLDAVTVLAWEEAGGSGVARVDLNLKRNQDGVYWTGSAWGTKAGVPLTTVFQAGVWKRSSGLPLAGAPESLALHPGSYTLIAYAYDRAGNRSSSTNIFVVAEPAATPRLPAAPDSTLSGGSS